MWMKGEKDALMGDKVIHIIQFMWKGGDRSVCLVYTNNECRAEEKSKKSSNELAEQFCHSRDDRKKSQRANLYKICRICRETRFRLAFHDTARIEQNWSKAPTTNFFFSFQSSNDDEDDEEIK